MHIWFKHWNTLLRNILLSSSQTQILSGKYLLGSFWISLPVQIGSSPPQKVVFFQPNKNQCNLQLLWFITLTRFERTLISCRIFVSGIYLLIIAWQRSIGSSDSEANIIWVDFICFRSNNIPYTHYEDEISEN